MNGDEFDLKNGQGAYYIRVSTDHQDTERQQASIRSWMEKYDVSVPEHFQFMDEGFVRDLPATRPEFQRMMQAVDKKLLRWIVADRQDRFGSKDKYQFIAFMNRLREGNCRFLTVDGKCWNDDSMMSFMEGGLGAETSEKEQKNKSWQVIQALIGKARRGEWSGGHVAYGMDVACFGADNHQQEKWRVVIEGREQTGTRPGKGGKPRRVYSTRRVKSWPDGKSERFDGHRNFPSTDFYDILRQTPSKDKTKLATVREVFTKFATEDISATQIATFLNDVGVPHHYAEQWEHYHVREMLKNPIYIGFQRWNSNGQGRFFEYLDGETRPVDDTNGRRERQREDWILSDKQLFAPVISDDLWESVQRRIDETPRETRSPKSPELWLSGLLYCSHCNKPMRGMTRPTRLEYFCSTYARSKDNGTCLRHGVNQEVIVEELRGYLKEASVEATAILDSQQTGNTELLKPYEDKHWENFNRFQAVIGRMILAISSHPESASLWSKSADKDVPVDFNTPPNDINELPMTLERDFRSVCDVYSAMFQLDETDLQAQLRELDQEHSELVRGLRNLDPEKAKRAIQKTNDDIEALEIEMEELEGRLENLTNQFDQTLEVLRTSSDGFYAAENALCDPMADNRRKARAVRSCIEKINLTFRPTGKKYPTSELVEIEFIPAQAEYPNGVSG